MKYKIYDWAGNRIGNKTFKTFDAAWDYILGEMTDILGLTEEDYQEYYVDSCGDRDSRYLDPNDPRASRVRA